MGQRCFSRAVDTNTTTGEIRHPFHLFIFLSSWGPALLTWACPLLWIAYSMCAWICTLTRKHICIHTHSHRETHTHTQLQEILVFQCLWVRNFSWPPVVWGEVLGLSHPALPFKLPVMEGFWAPHLPPILCYCNSQPVCTECLSLSPLCKGSVCLITLEADDLDQPLPVPRVCIVRRYKLSSFRLCYFFLSKGDLQLSAYVCEDIDGHIWLVRERAFPSICIPHWFSHRCTYFPWEVSCPTVVHCGICLCI